MEFHPVLNGTSGTNGVKGSADATKVPCPESVLKGHHRLQYDNGSLPVYSTRYSNFPNLPETYHLFADQIEQFHKDGILVVSSDEIWTKDELKLLINCVTEIDQWPEAAGKWMKYYEKNLDSAGNKLLARIENFTQYQAGLDYLLNGNKILSLSSQLFHSEAVLYKEKINYKLPGGEGFAPHQDVAAGWWMYGQSFHISALIAVDQANIANGCLEVVYGCHNRGILGEPWKEVDPKITAELDWKYVETKPGDVVFFDSYVPHRSGPNNTQKPRRVLYATYGMKNEGDYRLQYYADKRLSFPPDIERLQGKHYEYKI